MWQLVLRQVLATSARVERIAVGFSILRSCDLAHIFSAGKSFKIFFPKEWKGFAFWQTVLWGLALPRLCGI